MNLYTYLCLYLPRARLDRESRLVLRALPGREMALVARLDRERALAEDQQLLWPLSALVSWM